MKYITYITCLIGIMLTSSCSSEKQNEQRKKTDDAKTVRVAVTPTLDCLPVFVAKEIGIADEMGYRMILQRHTSKCDCDTALVGGSVDASFTDYARAEVMSAQDKKLKLYPHDNTQLYLFTNSKGRIRDVKQLVDKIIGVDRQGVEAQLAEYLVDSLKMDKERTFLVQVRNYDIRQKMLLVNTLDAAVLTEPFATHARKAGHRSMYSAYTVKNKPVGCMVTKSKHEVVRDAYNRACDSINKNGIHSYDSIIHKYYTIPETVIQSIPSHKFKKIIGINK